MYNLYGDGIHDDTDAIQELIDSAGCELRLPAPKNHYLISKTLTVPSRFKLSLPRFAEIRLAAASNCYMLRNKMTERIIQDVSHRQSGLFDYIYRYEADVPCERIEIEGGIWNYNNKCQKENPIQTDDYTPDGYTGMIMLFYNVKGLTLSGLTFKDPINFAVNLDRVSHFTISDVTFDYNYGNPSPINMDGIHVNGNCHLGEIRGLHGACRDDLVALNADEGSGGPITNIHINGLYATDCHSAVRLLSADNKVENVHISNIFGTYYQYCVGITKYYSGHNGGFKSITIDNVYASKAPRYDYTYPWPDSFVFPFIWVQDGLRIKDLTVRDVHRCENAVPAPTVFIGESTVIDRMVLSNISHENNTGVPFPLIENNGVINELSCEDLHTDGDAVMCGNGSVKEK